jgi:hypothetical protein
MASFLQVRTFSGVISSLICSNILNSKVQAFISGCDACTPQDGAILQFAPTEIPMVSKGIVQAAVNLYHDIFVLDLRVIAAAGGASVLVALATYEKNGGRDRA